RRRDRRRPAGARALHGMSATTRKAVRVFATLVFTGLAVAYLLWKIDLGKTADTLRATRFGWFALAIAIMIATVLPMAMRWQWLLRPQRMEERLRWGTRAYLFSYTPRAIPPPPL